MKNSLLVKAIIREIIKDTFFKGNIKVGSGSFYFEIQLPLSYNLMEKRGIQLPEHIIERRIIYPIVLKKKRRIVELNDLEYFFFSGIVIQLLCGLKDPEHNRKSFRVSMDWEPDSQGRKLIRELNKPKLDCQIPK